jgi:hypothetical protein
MKNNNTVYAVICPSWGTVVSIYKTAELADVAASVMSSETQTNHTIKAFSVIGEDVSPIDNHPELDLDV